MVRFAPVRTIGAGLKPFLPIATGLDAKALEVRHGAGAGCMDLA